MNGTPIEIFRSTVFEHYVYIPSVTAPGTGQDLTGYTFKAELRNKPGGTLLATFTTAANSPPPGYHLAQGWVKLSLDDSVVIPTGNYRGTWSLLASPTANNPYVVEAGPAEIFAQATS